MFLYFYVARVVYLLPLGGGAPGEETDGVAGGLKCVYLVAASTTTTIVVSAGFTSTPPPLPPSLSIAFPAPLVTYLPPTLHFSLISSLPPPPSSPPTFPPPSHPAPDPSPLQRVRGETRLSLSRRASSIKTGNRDKTRLDSSLARYCCL